MDLVITVVVAAAIFAAGLLGIYAQGRMSEEQKSPEVKGTIGQVAGLITLLLALVLGTLIGVSYSFFAGQKAALETLSAQVLQLDLALAQYGPETKPARAKLKESTQHAYDAIWGQGEKDVNLLTIDAPVAAQQNMTAFLATLDPKTELQKAAVAKANTYAGLVAQSRIMMALQLAGHPVLKGLLLIIVFWSVALFFAIGLGSKFKAAAIGTLLFGAVSVAFALFLVLELVQPFSGFNKVTPGALLTTLEFIGK